MAISDAVNRALAVAFEDAGYTTPEAMSRISKAECYELVRRAMLSQVLSDGVDELDIPAAALLDFAAAGKFDAVQAQLEAGISPNANNKAGQSALVLAATNGHLECTNALLAARADVNGVDKEGNTALHLACNAACESPAILLIDFGADIRAMNQRGKMPMDGLAESQPTDESVLQLLMAKGRREIAHRLYSYEDGTLPRSDDDAVDRLIGSMCHYRSKAWNMQSHRFFPATFRQVLRMLLLHSVRGPTSEGSSSALLPDVVWCTIFSFMNRDWIAVVPP